ncbi:hypothetical protein BJY04DRAFT_216948 [Aspergillus karnatakaensis]|uniref:uncharacterized protein n=1 Tax=Aspergillus karnatakaensis TaxID=1810916 RepID=UPI003CCD73C5
MSTPERKGGQTSWARPRQQQQQQHTSPFRRARRDRLRLGALQDISPPPESKPRHQRTFSQTGTLRGAFEFISPPRLPLAEKEDDQLFRTEYSPHTRRGSPRKRRQSSGAMSLNSTPPDELEDVYRQIDDANSLTDLEPSDDDAGYRRTSNEMITNGIRRQGLATDSHSFVTDSRRSSDNTRDEERLKRFTSSRSPILNKTTLGAGPSEHLQRRDSESYSISEDDGIEPSLNARSILGSRAKHNNSWMKSLTRSHDRATKSAVEEPGGSPSRASEERRARAPATHREPSEERPRSSHYELPRPPPAPPSPKVNGEYLTGGEQIPNTPIFVYPNSTFTKRSPSKRDSHALLQALARNGSPSQKTEEAAQTPEPTTTRHVYDKTPRVTGAWIDTPVTQRVPAPASRLEVNSSSGSKLPSVWELEKQNKEANGNDNEKTEPDGAIPNFEPSKQTAEKPLEESRNERPSRVTFETKDKQPEPEAEPTQDPPSSKAPEPKEERKPVELPLPDHPKSALETVLQDHKNNKESLDVGEDTIESLQAIVDQQPADETEAKEEDAAYEQQVIEQLESSQPSDMKDFERIEGKLQSLSDTMTNLKSGLNQLGNRVSRDTEYIIASLSKSPTQESAPIPEKSCEVCKGRGHGPSQQSPSLPLPRLWRRGPAWWKPRPTRLGWCALIAATWYFSESTMCDLYCHPRVDYNCEGNCLRPDAPRFPYALPTMLSRWLHLSDILLPIWTLLLAFFRFFTQLLGFSDGYVDDEPLTLNLTGKVYVEGTQIDGFSAVPTATARGFIPPVINWAWKEDPQQPQPDIPDPVPISVPDMNIDPGASAGSDPWDDVSMDEDEFL